MKAIILAAGMGTRLGSLVPKPLTELADGTMIFDYQVGQLERVVGLDSIAVVVGYKKELLMEKRPELIYIYNEAYATTNTSKSLLRAITKFDDDVLWLNGDVYFDPAVLDKLVEAGCSAALVDRSKCGDEQVKYDTYEDGTIRNLSKSVAEPLGEAVGINVIARDDRLFLAEELAAVGDHDYFEKALENLTLAKKVCLKPVYLDGLFCKEIDFQEDLEVVQAYISQRGTDDQRTGCLP